MGTFWLKIEQFWPFEEISIFSNGGHLGYRTALTGTILKGDHLRIISAKFGWDWLSSFRGEDFFLISSPFFLICIVGQNRQKFKVHKKSRDILCLYSSNLGTFWLIIEQFWPFEEISILVMTAILDTGRRWRTQFWKGTTQGSFQQSLVEIGSVVSEEKIFF